MTPEPPAAGSRPRIVIEGLGATVRGFQRLWFNGTERADASLHLDLHSALRVEIDGVIYDDTNAEITTGSA